MITLSLARSLSLSARARYAWHAPNRESNAKILFQSFVHLRCFYFPAWINLFRTIESQRLCYENKKVLHFSLGNDFFVRNDRGVHRMGSTEYVIIYGKKTETSVHVLWMLSRVFRQFRMRIQTGNYFVNNLSFCPKMSLQIEFKFGHLSCQWVNQKSATSFCCFVRTAIHRWWFEATAAAHLSIVMMLNGFSLC